ncbi:MAG: hypothetical protein CVT90_02820 [Candidatus Altiarchaeales archaeon HGW-Altiarchaeales-3]|nr:MAG: hypothetical protein CVT90_02820 [Candidatus Altiarchaeales archaeon HGW-Altiarchaeales-3]
MNHNIKTTISENREILKFIALLLFFTLLFHIIYQSFIINKEHFLRETTAMLVGFCLNVIGIENFVKDADIFFSSAKTFNVIYGCIGIYPVIVFASCVLAYPATIRDKIIGLIPGIIILYAIEIIRLTFLGVINVYWQNLFEITHVYFWQATLIIFVIILLFLWITKVVENESE